MVSHIRKTTFSNKQEDIYYIDGFAGRGVFLDGDRGSPLNAANEMFTVQKKHNEEFPDKPLRFHVINIEAEDDSFNMLQKLSKQNGNGVYITNILGSFKEESKKLLASRQIQTNACFWFVDPFYGARDFTFDDVIELLFEKGKPRFRKEVLINFMTYNIVRFLEHDIEKPYILKFLGASSVEEVLKEATFKENKKEQAETIL
jgi:three-Cys-motif partner protein